MSFDIQFNSARIKEMIDEKGSEYRAVIRPAAQAGIEVYYNEVKLRAPVGQSVHFAKKKKHQFQPGNLQRSIYQAYVDKESNEYIAVYRVSYNKEKAFYGKFVENGTSKMAAQPFIRPSYDAKQQEALNAVGKYIQESRKK